MKARPLLVGIALSAAVLGGARLAQGRAVRAPSTGEPCPPAGQNCCLIRTHKRFDRGSRTVRFVTSYTCAGQTTSRGTASLLLKLKTAEKCDEQPKLIPDGTLLRASGNFIRRKDGLAQFCGTFALVAGSELLYTGTLETLDRVGSHEGVPGVEQCELCDQKEHLEGWLTGHGLRLNANRFLRAVIVAHVTEQSRDGSKVVLDGAINGVVIDCSQHARPVPSRPRRR